MAWIKVGHLLSVISWMAALLYLPRLMVYHSDAVPGSRQSETFKVMERRLLKAIATPAMVGSWLFGLWLVAENGAWLEGWFVVKGVLVIGLSAFHGMLAVWVRDFARDANRRGARFYRIVNEVPTVLMIGIVVLAVVRPL